MVVRGFLRDGHIVRVRFAEACARNAHERRLLVEFVEVCSTGVAHRGMDTANQLVNGVAERALVRHAAFDAFRNELARLGILEILTPPTEMFQKAAKLYISGF